MPRLEELIDKILIHDSFLLGGVHSSEGHDFMDMIHGVSEWSSKFNRELKDVTAIIEPCLRQSILMSLIPAEALEENFKGSYDTAIDEHLTNLNLVLMPKHKDKIRTIVVNLRALMGLSSPQARSKSMSISELRTLTSMHSQILLKQNNRCFYCGAEFLSGLVRETLDHIAPKHIGDDPVDGSNWVLACDSCNSGKSNVFSWAANQYAFDYINRSDIGRLSDEITLHHRWIILARDKKCKSCNVTPTQKELRIRKIIKSGLSIPSNCAATCDDCLINNGHSKLKPMWSEKEKGRI